MNLEMLWIVSLLLIVFGENKGEERLREGRGWKGPVSRVYTCNTP